MLEEAKKINSSSAIEYIKMPIEDINYPENSFDVVISSLAFHYVKSFKDIADKDILLFKIYGYTKVECNKLKL